MIGERRPSASATMSKASRPAGVAGHPGLRHRAGMTGKNSMTSLVELSVNDGVGLIAFNRPEVRNAINDAMRKEFIAALEQAAADDAVRAVVLTGNGKAFCAGGDISGMKERLKAQPNQVAFNGWRRQGQTHKSVGVAARHAEAGDRGGQRRGGGPRLRHGARLRLHHGVRAGAVHDELRQARSSCRTAAACIFCRAASACRAPRS